MAALQLTILSDDEDESSNNNKGSSVGKKRKQQATNKHEDTDTSNDDESADEMDGNFEFGGLLVSVSFLYMINIIYAYNCMIY